MEPIEEAGSVQIDDVLVGRVADKDVESAWWPETILKETY
jgi:hypothetical protein